MLHTNFWRSICLGFVFIATGVASSSFAHSEINLPIYDSYHSVKAVRVYGEVFPHGDHWETLNTVFFDNGVYGISKSYWTHHESARSMSEMPLYEKGNIIEFLSDYRKDDHAATKEGKHYYAFKSHEDVLLPLDLYIDREHHFKRLPFIVSVAEHEENIHHWLSKDGHKYRYTIELSDGTIWLREQTTKWEKVWHEGAEIIRIGTSLHPVLINKHRVLDKDVPFVGQDDVLTGLQQLR